jgi:hypothetical protein
MVVFTCEDNVEEENVAVAAVVGVDDDAEVEVAAEFEVEEEEEETKEAFASRRFRASRRDRIGVAAFETGMETGTETGTTAVTSSSSSSDDNRLTTLFMTTCQGNFFLTQTEGAKETGSLRLILPTSL